uniref:Trifunctional purine biosynthetic protein adenosine-3 n=1 Tax=Clastoptera arizonana TaxID=38151 RepID=A0A1B6E880_9HEMI
MTKNILVIGGGGREHAICWKLSQSSEVKKIFVTPGNCGIATLNKVEIVSLDIKNFKSLSEWSITQSVSLVVVGPEDPLANGVADALVNAGIKCFGPGKIAAQIESNKDWSKQFMDRYDIPTARWKGFTTAADAKHFIKNADYPALVVKASGLAAGKGVIVASNKEEACAAVDEILTSGKFGNAGEVIVVEELLEGEEVSVLGFCDGKTVKAMLPAQDHKRALEGDKGLNTGGMGAYCPCPLITDKELKWVEENVLAKAVKGLASEKSPFVGVLFAGLMMTKDGPKVLEYNCRFGDPETEVVLPLLKSDLYTVMTACCEGRLAETKLEWASEISAVCVVMASRGYPESSSKGDLIKGLDLVANQSELLIFHSGTASTNEGIVTNGGRVLVTVALANQLAVAAAKATAACSKITYPGVQFRRDIAHKGIPRAILRSGWLTYKDSGVDIIAGDALVDDIKPAVAQTARSGVMGGLGGFGALFDIKAAGFKDPVLVSGTDGVGTKLKIAHECGIHSKLGIDLVAMCVNDILAQGAEPLFFLDYFASGHLEVGVAGQVVRGIAEGCKLSGCSLVGGETAEMPGLYAKGDYDLAGFAVGAVERNQLLPRTDLIKAGDVIIGLPSSGVHSNGYSLVRRVMDIQAFSYKDKAPFSSQGKSFGEELLTPTAIYVKDVLPLFKTNSVKALAHITGGGLVENIPRVLSSSIKVQLDAKLWKIPPVFAWLSSSGVVSEKEMLRTFNCGVGMVLVVSAEKKASVLASIPGSSYIGQVQLRQGDEPQVEVLNFGAAIEPVMKPFIAPLTTRLAARKRVGVLISGSGTNLQSLINATAGSNTITMGSEIVLVVSNKPDVEGLKRAERAGIPTKVIKHVDYGTREDFDCALHTALVNAGVDIICLAGFMRLLTPDFVKKWRGRLINIHPALLPLFKGVNAQKQALEANVCVSGCTVHFVEAEMDAGAIIAQKAVPIQPDDTEDTLVERIKLAEHETYPQALKLLATGKVALDLKTGKIIRNL